MVVFDAAFLTLILWDKADAPIDPGTHKPVERTKDRIELLVQKLHKNKIQILIPTPVLAEVLVQSGVAGMKYVHMLQKAAVFDIESFDTRAAIELSEIDRRAIDAGDKKSGELAPWQRIKIDRQIIAIAKVAGANTIYTNDGPLGRFAKRDGLTVIGAHEFPLPAEDAQLDMLAVLEQGVVSNEGPPNASELEEAGTEDDEVDISPELSQGTAITIPSPSDGQ